MLKVLVIGASGFIGNALYRFAEENGYDVEGWVRNTSCTTNGALAVDYNDSKELIARFDSFSPDIIFDCAGSALVASSIDNPLYDFDSNVVLTQKILYSLSKSKAKNATFVFLSSAAVYGNPSYLPIKEEMEANPLSPYALHKIMSEQACIFMTNHYNINIKIARIFSAYGVGLKKQLFWDMWQKYKAHGKIELFGNGTESRDYIYISDLINALFIIATSNSKDTIINVGNGEEVTLKKAAFCFADELDLDHSKVIFSGKVREGDPLNWKSDNNILKSIGYQPSISIENGIGRYVKWLKEIPEA